MKEADLLKKAPGQFKNLHPCTESVPAPCPVLPDRAKPAWFFLGFVEDWVKVYRYPPDVLALDRRTARGKAPGCGKFL